MTETYSTSLLNTKDVNFNDSCASSLKDDSFISESSEKVDSVRNLYESSHPSNESNDYYSTTHHQHNTSHSFIKNEYEQNIPNNIPDRFSYSKITSTIIFQNSNEEVTTKTLPDKKFAISSSDLITTFLINDDSFSQFTNPKEIEKDPRIKAYFLIKDNKRDKFMCNLNELIERLSLQGEYVSQNIITFLKGLNAFFKEKDYKKIKQRNQMYYILLFGTMLILALCVLFFIIYDLFTLINSNSQLYVYIIHLLLMICCVVGVYLLYTKRHVIKIKAKFNLMNYFHGNYSKYFEYIEAWNKSIFETNHIRVSIPISVDYLLFNMDPYQDIKIKDINMDVIKGQLGIHGMLFEAAIIDDNNKDINASREVSYGGINGVRDTQASLV